MELVILNFIVDVLIVIAFGLSIHYMKSAKKKLWHPIDNVDEKDILNGFNHNVFPDRLIQFHFSKNAISVLDKLKSDIKAEDYANVIREAIAHYMWFIEAQKAGNKIIVEDKFGEQKRIKLKFPINQ